MGKKKQHGGFEEKLELRRRFLPDALAGPVYVPFVGDGDLAAALYMDRKIFAADVDARRVSAANSRLPESVEIKIANCDQWPFPAAREPFAVADFDSYANPYPSIASFWKSGVKAARIVLFGTDAQRLNIKRARSVVKSLPKCEHVKAEKDEQADEQFQNWFPSVVLPWLSSLPGIEVEKSDFLYVGSANMCYWAVVAKVNVEKASEKKPGRKPYIRFDADKKAEYIRLLSEGVGRCAAAKAIGVNYSTIQDNIRRDAAFQKSQKSACDIATDEVENALYRTALAGNTTAILFWLMNRRSDEWKDRRNAIAEIRTGDSETNLTVHLNAEEINDKLSRRLALVHRGGLAAPGGNGSE